jgi:hypothetical protein
LAITPPVRVEPLFPPHPTSITLSEKEKIKTSSQDFKINPQRMSLQLRKMNTKRRKKRIERNGIWVQTLV